jgi:hypothetical protein
MATIQENIERLQQAKLDLKVAITAKGVDVDDSALIDDYADYVSEIETGGNYQEKTYTITDNGDYTITPDAGYDAISGGTISVDVQGAGGNRLNEFVKNEVTALTYADLSGVTTIPNYFANQKTNLKSVQIPDSVTSIGSNAFSYCYDLTSVTIPDSVTSIDSYVFSYCKSLTSVTIGNSVTSIGSQAFQNCSGLTSITLPDSVTSIGGSAFEGCSGLTGNFIIPAGFTANTYTSSLWKGCSGITSFVFMGTPNNIGYSSASNSWFYGCSSVEYFDFSHCVSVPNLVSAANFTALTQSYEIRVPEILYDEWTGTTNWSNASVVSHIVSVPNPYETSEIHYTTPSGATLNTSNLTPASCGAKVVSNTYDPVTGGTVELYGDFNKIPANCFKDKGRIDSIELPEGLVEIVEKGYSYGPFYDTGLKSISLPSTFTKFGEGALQQTSLTGITFPSSVTYIGKSAFNTAGLQGADVVIPDSVTYLGENAFYGCKLNSVTIGDGLTSIGSYAFAYCTALTSVTIGDGVTDIGSGAFQNCNNLTTVTIGSGITTIGNSAFFNLLNIVDFTIYATVPPISTGTLMTTTQHIYVPAESVDAYKASPAWSDYASKIQAIQE